MSKNPDNKTGLGFDKFQIITGINNTSSGKAKRGNIYTIAAGDKVATRAVGPDQKDWFIVTTPILKVAASEGAVKAIK